METLFVVLFFNVQKGVKPRNLRSFYVSVKLPTYPSPKPTLTLSSYLGQNVGLGRGRWSVSQKRKMIRNLATWRVLYRCSNIGKSPS